MSHSVIKMLSLVSVVAMIIAIPVNSQAASNIFIKFEGVEGESEDEDYKGWVDVLGWNWGLSSSGKTGACVQDISIVKYVDSATNDLIQAVPSNKIFPQVQLIVRSAGGENPLPYLVYNMSNVQISSVSTGGSFGETKSTENVSFNFEELAGVYRSQLDTGNAGPDEEFFVTGKCK